MQNQHYPSMNPMQSAPRVKENNARPIQMMDESLENGIFHFEMCYVHVMLTLPSHFFGYPCIVYHYCILQMLEYGFLKSFVLGKMLLPSLTLYLPQTFCRLLFIRVLVKCMFWIPVEPIKSSNGRTKCLKSNKFYHESPKLLRGYKHLKGQAPEPHFP